MSKKDRNALRSVRRAFSAFGQSFSEGTDKIADACLDNSAGGKNNKARKIKTESLAMLQGMAFGIQRELEDVTIKEVFDDTWFELGRLSKATRLKGVKMIHDLIKETPRNVRMRRTP